MPAPKPAPPEPSPLGCAAALAGLDPEQVAAATTLLKRTTVNAGAGTGKTRTLVARIAFLVNSGVNPGRIVCVTFTNKAAGEIRERVGRFLGKAVSKRIRIGTFHSLSVRILRRYAKQAGLERDFQIVDEDDVRRVMRDAVIQIHAAGEANASDEAHARIVGDLVDRSVRRIGQWKSYGITADDAEALEACRRTPEDVLIGRIYAAYQDDLRRRNRVDFGDLVLMVNTTLANDEELRDEITQAVEFILVDEAQDANPAQVRWVTQLAEHHRCVMAIGDADQSIFSFQGGYPDALADMTVGGGRHEFALTLNRRCTSEILEPAVMLVGWNRRDKPKVLRSERSGPPPTLQLCSNDMEEATWIARHVRDLVASGEDPSSIAILFRSAWLMRPIEEALIKAGIGNVVVGGHSMVARADVRDIRAYMLLALDAKDDLSFGRVFNTPLRGLGAAACDFVVSRMIGSGDTCLQALSLTHFADRSPLSSQWRSGFDQLHGHLAQLEAYARIGEIKTLDLLDYVLSSEGVGFEAHVRKTKDPKDLRNRLETLQALRRIAIEWDEPKDFVDMIGLVGEDDGLPERGAVTLTTMHSAKGLEWDHVICPAFDEAAIPSPRAIEAQRSATMDDVWRGSAGGMDEERRLAHVAFTRARKTLTVTTRMSRNGRPIGPSVFLAESGLEKILGVDAYEVSKVRPVGRTKAADRAGRKGFSRR